jgi:hypothetical protein
VNLRYLSKLLIPDIAIALYEFSISLIGLTNRETLYSSSGAGRWFISGPSILLISYILPLSSRHSPFISLTIIVEARKETSHNRQKKVG